MFVLLNCACLAVCERLVETNIGVGRGDHENSVVEDVRQGLVDDVGGARVGGDDAIE